MVEKRILHSSIWREDSDTRIVWFTMMLMLNLEDGTVKSSVPGLADAARVSLEKTVAALERFQAPDKWSSNDAHEGRRIETIKGGWRLLNYEEVKKAHQKDKKKSYMRSYMQEYRAPEAGSPADNGGDITREMAMGWLAESNKAGSDYTEKETIEAFLYFARMDWKDGNRRITDYRFALEEKIQKERRYADERAKGRNAGAGTTTRTVKGAAGGTPVHGF